MQVPSAFEKRFQEYTAEYDSKKDLEPEVASKALENYKQQLMGLYSEIVLERRDRLYATGVSEAPDAEYFEALEKVQKPIHDLLQGWGVDLETPHSRIAGEDIIPETGTLFSEAELSFIGKYIEENRAILGFTGMKLPRGYKNVKNAQGRFDLKDSAIPLVLPSTGESMILKYSLTFDEEGNCIAQYSGKDDHLLGEGSFGRVKIGQKIFNSDGTRCENRNLTQEGIENPDKGWVAIKIITQGKVSDRAEKESDEVAIGRELKRVVGATSLKYEEKGITKEYVFMPLNSISIDDYECGSYSEKLELAIQTAEEIQFLHSKGIIHNDIKGPNMMRSIIVPKKVVSVDFGLSLDIEHLPEGIEKNEDDTYDLPLARGTPGYMAPELIEDAVVSEKTDIYAYGILLIKDLGLYNPSGSEPHITLHALILISQITNQDSDERPSLKKIIKVMRNMKADLDAVKILGVDESEVIRRKAVVAIKTLCENAVRNDRILSIIMPDTPAQSVIVFGMVCHLLSFRDPFYNALILERSLLAVPGYSEKILALLAPNPDFQDICDKIVKCQKQCDTLQRLETMFESIKQEFEKEKDTEEQKILFKLMKKIEAMQEGIDKITTSGEIDLNDPEFGAEFTGIIDDMKSKLEDMGQELKSNLLIEFEYMDFSAISAAELLQTIHRMITLHQGLEGEQVSKMGRILERVPPLLANNPKEMADSLATSFKAGNVITQDLMFRKLVQATSFFIPLVSKPDPKRAFLMAKLSELAETDMRAVKQAELSDWFQSMLKRMPKPYQADWLNICTIITKQNLATEREIKNALAHINQVERAGPAPQTEAELKNAAERQTKLDNLKEILLGGPEVLYLYDKKKRAEPKRVKSPFLDKRPPSLKPNP